MVLMYGIPGDGPFELIIDALEDLGIPFVTLNQRDFEKVEFSFVQNERGLSGHLTIAEVSYDLSLFTGIYNRAVEFSMLPEAKALGSSSPSYQQYAQTFKLLNQWIELANCRVMNKASAMSSNSSKPYQSTLIQPYFKVPPTLITNEVEAVKSFAQQYGTLIYKSASSVRSVVHSVDYNSLDAIGNIRNCPTQFQQKLEGTNYRVHIIGDKIFPVKVTSPSVDYRYAQREGNETDLQTVTLAPDLTQKCFQLSKALKLPLAGIDLFETKLGDWYCFEVNPSPGFSYFENETGQPLSREIALYLSSAAKNITR